MVSIRHDRVSFGEVCSPDISNRTKIATEKPANPIESGHQRIFDPSPLLRVKQNGLNMTHEYIDPQNVTPLL